MSEGSQETQAKEEEMDRKPSDQHPHSRNILLVDDERLILSCLARQMRGHKVFKAGDVISALGLLEDEDIDLVLTDYRMPGGDGVSLLEIAQRKYPHVRRAMMSAASPLNLGELINSGVVEHFFPKPFGIALAAEVLDLLRDEPSEQGQAADTVPPSAVVEHNAHMQ